MAQWLKYSAATLKVPGSRLASDAFSSIDLGKVPKSDFLGLKFLQLQAISTLTKYQMEETLKFLTKISEYD